MTEFSEAIEEMIEESYLLGLTENEIREDIGRFVETCWKVIREHVKDKKMMSELAERLEEARASAFVADQIDKDRGGVFKTDGTPKTHQELIAEKAARNKRRLLRAIRECDPRLVELIDRERYRNISGKSEEEIATPPVQHPSKTRILVLKGVYICSVVFLLLLLYMLILGKLR